MIFTETPLQGAYVIDPEKREDHRGFNARVWCQDEFKARNLITRLVQCNVIHNRRKGTLRGLHYQAPPYGESKVFRCTRGAVYDVIIDLRPDSPTYRRWFGIELSAANYRMLYIPENVAQGFLTRTDDTELAYQVSQFHTPSAERGIRYDDPAFGIEWPGEVEVLSDKDKRWPDFQGTP